MTPRVILWDVMDTLVHDPFREVMPRIFGLDLPELLRVKSPHAWPRFERGEIDEAAYFAEAFTDGRTFDGQTFREAMVAGYQWLPGMEALLAKLAADGVEMHTLSNYTPWSEHLDARLGVSRYASWRFVSWRTGVRKPDAAAYLGPLEALGVDAADVLFVDDREVNAAAARAVGMQAVVFDGAEGMRRRLGR